MTRGGAVALPSTAAQYTVKDLSGATTFTNKTYSGGALTISGLTSFTTYSFRIQATGFVDATPVAVTTTKTLSAAYVAGSVTATTAQYTLSSASSLPGSVTVTNGATNISTDLSGNTLTLSGLSEGTTYSSLKVTATGYQIVTLPTLTTVGAFTIATESISAGANYVILGITPLGGTQLSATPANWSITYPGGTVSASDISYNSAPTPKQLRIGGLSEYTSYAFTVTPTGVPSQSVTVRTKDVTVPGLITGLTANASNESVTLSWNDLIDSGSAISYVVKNLGDNTTMTYSTNSATISSLTNGTSYTFEVKAVDADGNIGTPTTVTATPYTLPGKPTISSVTEGATAGTVAWGNVSSGGLEITNFTVRAYVSTDLLTPVATATGSVSPITVSGLTANRVYVFTVTATNAAGDGPTSDFSAPKFIDDVVCFLADAPVRVPGGVRAIAEIQKGDLVMTADGRAVAVRSVSITQCEPGKSTNPYLIPRGKWGATEDLRISPNHKVAVGNGRMIEAKNLGLKQVKMPSTITYYNLELPNWATDRLIVAGVEVESLAAVRRKIIPVAQFNAMIARKYGPKPSPAIVDKLTRMCVFLPNDMVEYPAMSA